MTPMMEQYQRIKKENKNTILFFRLGDFYEMFFDDAVTASRILEITLTSRDGGEGTKVPMAGIPYHAADPYIQRLVKAGHRIAICEQTEDPKLAKGIVKREVTRIISAGTLLSGGVLEEKKNNYLMSIVKNRELAGLAFIDLSTGEFRVTELTLGEKFYNELIRIDPREYLLPAELSKDQGLLDRLKQWSEAVITPYDDWIFGYDTSYQNLVNHFNTLSLEGFGCDHLKLGTQAAGALIHYLNETQKSALPHINSIRPYSEAEFMVLDASTQCNLELVKQARSGAKQGTLLSVLDDTKTAMGGRLLRTWITQPLLDVEKIIYRQEGVEQFVKEPKLRDRLTELLKDMRDIERLIARINCRQANARDLAAIKESLKILPQLNKEMEGITPCHILKDLTLQLENMDEVVSLIENTLVDTPPHSVREGGLIKKGYDRELDELRNIARGGKEWIASLERAEIKRTGINSLKVGYNRVFGYYIEVTRPNLKSVPSDYIRKQTLVNSERFITPALKEYESRVLTAEEKIAEREYNIFLEIQEKVIGETKRIQSIARAIAVLDVLTGLAQAALRNGYIRPEVNDKDTISIIDGRHPVLERALQGEQFVPNDTLLDATQNQVLVITGPNMAGKSTYIRQVALIVLMAQTGSFIPAKKAVIGVVDRIFTRVGAQDELTRGQSTFMIEMNETANILNNATSRSLIVLDEIGRGTSTFDGVSIAWAVAEYIHDNPSLQAKTLLATHYHELTELPRTLSRAKNYNIAVREWNDRVIFLRKIVEGGTDKSYGIYVARLAGMPLKVITRAKEILSALEGATLTGEGKPKFARHKEKRAKEKQLTLFDPEPHPVINELRELDLENMTPLEALNKLEKLKEKSKNE